MLLVIADRVRETSTTTGSGSLTLAGAVTGYRTFSSTVGTGNTTYYSIVNQAVPSEWEVGYGTLSASTTLARTAVIASSNSNAAVNFSAGTKDVFVTKPAETDLLADPGVCEGRLTLTSGTPVTTSDVTAAGTVYFTPYTGNRISLYDGTKWKAYQFSEVSLAISATSQASVSGTITNTALTVTSTNTTGLYVGQPITGTGIPANTFIYSIDSGTQLTMNNAATSSTTTTLTYYGANYDVFIYDNAGTLTLQMVAWANNTTRVTAVTTQDGVYVKSGDTAKRYLGSVRVTGTTIAEDSVLNRFVWNYYNRLPRKLYVFDSSVNWTYTTAAFRIAGGNTANRVQLFSGIAESPASVMAVGMSSSTGAGGRYTGIGYDSTTANTADASSGAGGTSILIPTTAILTNYPAAGYHFFAWLEYATATGTVTWTSNNGVIQTGMNGTCWA